MALVRVAQYGSVPGPVTDYQAQNAHLQAFTNQLLTQQFILDSGTTQPVIKQGCYVSHGGSLYVADADTAITGSPADGSVYIRVSGTTTLTVEFINNISGYTWNPVYSALTSSTYTLLPYLIVKAGAVWTRYNFNPNNQSFGAISCASVDTGYGANEVYKISEETIAFGDVIDTDKTMSISAMAIKEIRMVNTTGSIKHVSGDPNHLFLELPAGGTYFVVGQFAPYDPSVQIFVTVYGGVFSGGATVAQLQNDNYSGYVSHFNVGLIVRRIS